MADDELLKHKVTRVESLTYVSNKAHTILHPTTADGNAASERVETTKLWIPQSIDGLSTSIERLCFTLSMWYPQSAVGFRHRRFLRGYAFAAYSQRNRGVYVAIYQNDGDLRFLVQRALIVKYWILTDWKKTKEYDIYIDNILFSFSVILNIIISDHYY